MSAVDTNYSPPQTNVTLPPPDLSDQDFLDFTGSEYYVRKWSRSISRDKSLAGFNWSAAVFGSVWALYRKMYWFAAGVFLSGFLVGATLSVAFAVAAPDILESSLGTAIPILAAVLVRTVVGFLANVRYLNHARRAAASIAVGATLEERSEHFKSAGGLNEAAMWIGIVIMVLLNVGTRLLQAT